MALVLVSGNQFHSIVVKAWKNVENAVTELRSVYYSQVFLQLTFVRLLFVLSRQVLIGLKLKAVITEPAQSETRVKYQSNRAIDISPQGKIFQVTSSDCLINENERSVCLGVRQRGL